MPDAPVETPDLRGEGDEARIGAHELPGATRIEPERTLQRQCGAAFGTHLAPDESALERMHALEGDAGVEL